MDKLLSNFENNQSAPNPESQPEKADQLTFAEFYEKSNLEIDTLHHRLDEIDPKRNGNPAPHLYKLIKQTKEKKLLNQMIDETQIDRQKNINQIINQNDELKNWQKRLDHFQNLAFRINQQINQLSQVSTNLDKQAAHLRRKLKKYQISIRQEKQISRIDRTILDLERKLAKLNHKIQLQPAEDQQPPADEGYNFKYRHRGRVISVRSDKFILNKSNRRRDEMDPRQEIASLKRILEASRKKREDILRQRDLAREDLDIIQNQLDEVIYRQQAVCQKNEGLSALAAELHQKNQKLSQMLSQIKINRQCIRLHLSSNYSQRQISRDKINSIGQFKDPFISIQKCYEQISHAAQYFSRMAETSEKEKCVFTLEEKIWSDNDSLKKFMSRFDEAKERNIFYGYERLPNIPAAVQISQVKRLNLEIVNFFEILIPLKHRIRQLSRNNDNYTQQKKIIMLNQRLNGLSQRFSRIFNSNYRLMNKLILGPNDNENNGYGHMIEMFGKAFLSEELADRNFKNWAIMKAPRALEGYSIDMLACHSRDPITDLSKQDFDGIYPIQITSSRPGAYEYRQKKRICHPQNIIVVSYDTTLAELIDTYFSFDEERRQIILKSIFSQIEQQAELLPLYQPLARELSQKTLQDHRPDSGILPTNLDELYEKWIGDFAKPPENEYNTK